MFLLLVAIAAGRGTGIRRATSTLVAREAPLAQSDASYYLHLARGREDRRSDRTAPLCSGGGGRAGLAFWLPPIRRGAPAARRRARHGTGATPPAGTSPRIWLARSWTRHCSISCTETRTASLPDAFSFFFFPGWQMFAPWLHSDALADTSPCSPCDRRRLACRQLAATSRSTPSAQSRGVRHISTRRSQ